MGRDLAEQLLKGCSVHWQRSCQHIADRIVSSKDKAKEKKVFLNIAYSIQKLRDSPSIVACFETLCGVRTVKQLLQKMPSLCSKDDADFIDKNCNWSLAKHWAQWWTIGVTFLRCSLEYFSNGQRCLEALSFNNQCR